MGTTDRVQAWYSKKVKGGPTDGVTLTYSSSTKVITLVDVVEYSGLDPSAPLDVYASGTGFGTAQDTGPSPTTTAAKETIVGIWAFAGYGGNPFTAGPGFTFENYDATSMLEDMNVTASGVFDATAKSSNPVYWAGYVIAFRAANQPALVTPGCDGAGNCYVYASASGSGIGANWTNACPGFSGPCDPTSSSARGVTFWVAAGNYGALSFSAPDSGTTITTVKAATAASHGPAADWNNSSAGQAVFSASSVDSDYWTFTGQTRGADWQSGYNLKFWNQSNPNGASVTLSGSHVTFDYVEMEGTGEGFPNNSTADRCSTNNCGAWSDDAIHSSAGITNLYVGHGWEHHTGNAQFQMNGVPNNNVTWEYNCISYNHTGQNGQHDEAYSLYASNVLIRYNVFQDISGSGIITTAGAGSPALSNWDVYGNLFFWDASYAAFSGQYGLATIDNAVLDFLGEIMFGYVHFYNNTMAGLYNAVADGNGSAFSTLAVSGLSGYSSGNPTVQIYNNLWYRSGYATGNYTAYCAVVTGATCVQDYDAFYQGSIPIGDFQNPSEAHAQIVPGTSSPFVNFSAGTLAGFHLLSDSNGGISLASPYNFDGLDQVARSADGVWDRGALQSSTAVAKPAPPTNLAVTSIH